MPRIVLIAHNLRSCHNVGSLLRTADGLGVSKVYLTGYTPYPAGANDARLPHLAQKIAGQIHKTALGAENFVPWQHSEKLDDVFAELKKAGFTIAAFEQDKGSIKLPEYTPPQKIALVVGREVEGIEPEILTACDITLEIPMLGQKESFNVVQAAAIALYHCRFLGQP
jgi:tRNA G18 (ribose-2'-O)-methylase SpoU